MCGIAGIYNYKTAKPVSASLIESMCQPVIHRGPDGSGIFTSGSVGLGHRRLSIIDVDERSNQPMTSTSSQSIICYNGEVYNYRELRPSLESGGFSFRTQSDTEVLLNLYERDGPECLEKLNGMFSFAIWSESQQSLFLARDRLGIKPLYYCITSDGIVFASEIKSILAALPQRPGISEAAIDAFMSFGYVPGEQTCFDGIKKLLPGHYLIIKNGVLSQRQYWDFEIDRNDDLGFDHYRDKTIELLEDAVRLRLRSDVPLGVFLSGGVDSSAVVAMMKHLEIDPIKTFSVRWDHGSSFDETKYARQVSSMFATEHREYTMSEDDFVSFLPRFQWLMDEPVTEAAAVSLYYIASKATEDVTVVLSGEGADEVFGGYPIYRYMRWVERYKGIPSSIRSAVTDPLLRSLGSKYAKYVEMSKNKLENSYFGVSFYDASVKSSVCSAELKSLSDTHSHSTASFVADIYERTKNWDPYSRMQYLDVKTWLVDDLLIKADRMSMAASLELRVPFLDHRFLEFSATIPTKYLVGEFESKKLLKRALEPYLPRNILYRKKMGFPTPVARLLRGSLGTMAQDLFSSNHFRQSGYFNSTQVTKLLDSHRAGQQDNHKVLWQLLIFELWRQSFEVA